MHAHINVHFDHNHDRLFSRISRDLGAAYDWLAGPGMSGQERMSRELAEVRNGKYSNGAV